jgi:hypothetical protein
MNSDDIVVIAVALTKTFTICESKVLIPLFA